MDLHHFGGLLQLPSPDVLCLGLHLFLSRSGYMHFLRWLHVGVIVIATCCLDVCDLSDVLQRLLGLSLGARRVTAAPINRGDQCQAGINPCSPAYRALVILSPTRLLTGVLDFLFWLLSQSAPWILDVPRILVDYFEGAHVDKESEFGGIIVFFFLVTFQVRDSSFWFLYRRFSCNLGSVNVERGPTLLGIMPFPPAPSTSAVRFGAVSLEVPCFAALEAFLRGSCVAARPFALHLLPSATRVPFEAA